MNISKLQLAARRTIQENFPFLIIMELFVLLFGLRVLDGALVPYIGWYRFLSYAILVPGGYFAVLLIIRLFQDASDAERERAGNLVFRGTVGWRVLLFVSGTSMFAMDVGIYHQMGQLPMWAVASTAAMALLAFYAWPRVIDFTNSAVRQRNTFGGMKSILFSDITDAQFDARQQCIIVSGKGGARIIHTPLHADRQQFVRQLQLLTGTQILGLAS